MRVYVERALAFILGFVVTWFTWDLVEYLIKLGDT